MDVINKINKAKNIWQILPELTVDELEEVITLSADSYYNSDTPLISDDIYDILVEKLTQLKPNSKILKIPGAGSHVKGKKVKLPVWMGSMDKIKSDDKLIDKWTKRYQGPYVISDKLDGISCLLTLNNGEINLYTRGDGTYGQQITHLAVLVNMSIDNLLQRKFDKPVLIRGELIMDKTKFKKYKEEKSNARNMVAGIVNSKKDSVNNKQARDVDFIAYELIEPPTKPSKQLKMLEKWGLNVVYYDIYHDIDLNILDSILQKRKKKSVYEIDGIIVTDDAEHVRNISGNPPYSFAYKGLTQTANVKVLGVEWNPSKDGFLVPRIRFEKVRLSQADLEYTTGFHAKFIVKNRIGPGAIITVIRSGDVIPYIMNVVKPADNPSMPKGYDYVWDKNKVNIILKNADENETVIVRRLTKFLKVIGVSDISEGIVRRLVSEGYNSIFKIIILGPDDLLELDGFQETLAYKLHHNLISALENLDILTLMVASNVFGRGFGEKKLKKILETYPNIVHQFDKNKYGYWKQEIMQLDGFDEISTDHFLLALPKFQSFYQKMIKLVDIKPYEKKSTKNGLFNGQIVVFTGFRNKEWEKFIENEGGKVTGSVSKNTTLLVFNDGEESSAKYQRAKKLEIKTMSKSDFAKKYRINV